MTSTVREFVHRHEGKSDRGYAPSFFAEGFLTELQPTLVDVVEDVYGKLEPPDHFKLYELGFFARGPIVEVGRLAAKSTIILALGNRDGGRDDPIYSIENHHKSLPTAEENLRGFDLLERTTLIQGDSATQLGRVPVPFDVLFLDGDHSYEGVRRDLVALRGKLTSGGVLAIHDYYHRNNETGEYGVKRAVDELAEELSIAFRGRFGGIALYEQL